MISKHEKERALHIAKTAIFNHLSNKPSPNTDGLKEFNVFNAPMGLFVTLNIQGQLRGCIGCITSQTPLFETIPQYAIQAAVKDPRFPPLSLEEFQKITLKLSILTEPESIQSAQDIQLGAHGILFHYQSHRSVFLPEVAIEHGWSLIQTLEHLALKAGCQANDWQKAQYQVFKTIVFGE